MEGITNVLQQIGEMASKVEVWLGYLLTLITLASFIVATVKAIKEKKFGKIKELAIGFIQEAETLKAKDGVSAVSGETKKAVVLSKIMTSCQNFGVKYNEDTWSQIIDEYVAFTLKVNSRATDKAKITAA